jgi:hypothetical protein
MGTSQVSGPAQHHGTLFEMAKVILMPFEREAVARFAGPAMALFAFSFPSGQG